LLRTEGTAWLNHALLTLPPQVQRAFFLHFIQGWPLSSTDPNKISVSAVLGVSPRMINNYLRRGSELLRELYEKEHPDEQA
jgi:DNA-directed RNA polymerase specialized sigma24 family protein